jgi:WD40 repeat protein
MIQQHARLNLSGYDIGRYTIRPIALLALLACILRPLSAQHNLGHVTQTRPVTPRRPQLFLQYGHTAEVQGMAFSPDDTLLATADHDGAVKVWNLRTGDQCYSYTTDPSWTISLAISPDGKTLATFVRSGKLSLRDLSTGRLLRTLDNESEPSALAFSPDGTTLALSGQDAGVSLWNYRTGQRLRAISTHVDRTGEVAVLAFSPDGSRLACAGSEVFGDGNVEIWNVRDGTLAANLVIPSVDSIAFSLDSKILAVGTTDLEHDKASVELWDLAQSMVVKHLPVSAKWLAFSPDGLRIAGGNGGDFLFIVDVHTGNILHRMGVSGSYLSSFASPDARLGVVAESGGTLRVFDLNSGKLVRSFPGAAYKFSGAAAFSADGKTLLTGVGSGGNLNGEENDTNTLLRWDTRAGNRQGLPLVSGCTIYKLAMAAQGTCVVTSDIYSRLQVWDLARGQVTHPIADSKRSIDALAVSPDGGTLVLGGSQPKMRRDDKPQSERHAPRDTTDPLLEMVDLQTGRRLRALSGHKELVNAAHYSANGSLLATLSYDDHLILWNARTGAQQGSISTGPKTPECMALSGDGRLAAIGYEYAPVHVYALPTGRLVRVFTLPDQLTGTIALSPDGKWVAVGGSDGIVRAWNLRSGRLREMHSPDNSIAWVGFAPDGQRLATLDGFGFLRVWDFRTGTLLATFVMVSPQDWLVFTPEGYYEGPPGVEQFFRWRVGDQLVPGSRYRTQFYRPDRVQTALSGKPQPVIYAQLRAHAEIRRRRLAAAMAQPKPTNEPAPAKEPNTPTNALKAALTTIGVFGDPQIQERVRSRIKTELAAGADPNTQGGWGTSPLMFLAACGDIDGVRDLLNRKANVDLVDAYGATALLEAIRMGHEELVPVLLQVGADLKDEQGHSLLKLKGDRNALSAAMLRILKLGTKRFNAPVQQFDIEATAWMLLYLGADPNISDADGTAPVMLAYYPYLMKQLLLKGPDPNARNKDGTPVIVELSTGGHTELIKLLLDHGADINATDKNGGTALRLSLPPKCTTIGARRRRCFPRRCIGINWITGTCSVK